MVSKNPLVSICIPAYNAEKWIQSTLESAINQTWPNKEIIIVDDGSTDNTINIAKKYESSNIRVIRQVNRGASVARNYALTFAQGDFIQWLDADDILAFNKIEKQIYNSDKDSSSLILHSSAFGKFYYRLKTAKSNPGPLWQDLLPHKWLRMYLGEDDFMYPAAWLISRKLTELAGPWDERLSYNDDGEYFARIVSVSDLVKFHRESMSYYRKCNLSSLSRTISFSEKAIISFDLSINLCVDYLLKLDKSDSSRNACVNALNLVLKSTDDSFEEIREKCIKRIFELGGQIKQGENTKKYLLIQKLFGIKTAILIKTKLWYLKNIFQRTNDKLMGIIFNDIV